MVKKHTFRNIVLVSLIIYFLITIYYLFFAQTSKSYSFVQRWKEYYSLEDWNIPTHAIADFDGDGHNDIITFTGCAFLSSVKVEMISFENRCTAEGMSSLVFNKNEVLVGQRIGIKTLDVFYWLRKSYLVKTQGGDWKFYDMYGLNIRVFKLGKDYIFKETEVSILDKFDAVSYQMSHAGVILIFSLLSYFNGTR